MSPRPAAALTALGDMEDGPRLLLRLAVNQAAAARGLAAPWDPGLPRATADRLAAVIGTVIAADPASWGAEQLGSLYEAATAAQTRKDHGIWFTPRPVAEAITEMAIPVAGACACGDPACGLDPAAHDPACGLQVAVLDPACGAGIFLITAARRIAAVYAALVSGRADPPPAAVRFALPVVLQRCVFGTDLDPVAVEVARSACWLEIGGTRPVTWMDDNIVAGDTLAGALPKPLQDLLTGPTPLIILGNPPYRDKARGAAPWVEARRRPAEDPAARPSLDDFRLPGRGRTEYVLSSLSVYFWRWAIWQAFEARRAPGAVAFITPAAYQVSPAFGGMRQHMRRCADQGWIIEMSPEGHQPKVSTRIFRDVQQPLCIGVLTRDAEPHPQAAARFRCAAVTGDRHEKIAQLQALARSAAITMSADAFPPPAGDRACPGPPAEAASSA